MTKIVGYTTKIKLLEIDVGFVEHKSDFVRVI